MKTTTCIVGYNDKKNKILYIGGDSAGVAGTDIRIRKDEKVFRNGNVIFGFTSSFRMGQLLRYKLEIPKQNKEQSDYEFLVTDFVDAVRKCLKNNGYIKIKDNEEIGGTFIIGYKNNLYCIEDDFQVEQLYDNFMATGCGEDYALGCLYGIKDVDIFIKSKIIKALESASYFSGGVSAPFNIIGISYKGESK